MPEDREINSRIQVRFLPAPAEDDDLETLSLVEEVRSEFLAEMAALQLYTVERISDQTRGGGFIIMMAKLIQGIGTQKDLLIQMLKTSQPAIDNLSKRKHIQSIDMNGNSLRIGNATEAQADRALEIYQSALLQSEAQNNMPPNQMELIVIITRDDLPAITERTPPNGDK
jgi:hypothetical protein